MARILITGASSGIGRGLVERLAPHDLVLAGRDAGRLADAARFSRSAQVISPDLADPASLAAHLAEVTGPLDGLVHVAGVSDRELIADATLGLWERQLAVNLLSPVIVTRLLLAQLREVHGTVVFVNSVTSLTGSGAGGSAYAASKAALRSFADQLRLEEPSLRVGTVYAGRVATEMQRALRVYEGLPYEQEKYASAESMAGAIEAMLLAPQDVEMRDMTVMPRTR